MSDYARGIIFLILSHLCFGGCVCCIWLAVLVDPLLFAFLAFLLLMVTLILSVLSLSNFYCSGIFE